MSDGMRWVKAVAVGLLILAVVMLSPDAPRWAISTLPLLAYLVVYYGGRA